MRIGIFTDTYPPYVNGVSTSIMMLKKSLENLGHTVYVVTVNDEQFKYKLEDEAKIIRLPSIPSGIYDYRVTGVYPLGALNKIRKWNLDIIHSHTEFGVGIFARIIAKQYNIPIVHTYHTMYEDYIHYITKGYFNGVSKKIVEYLTSFYCDKSTTELIVVSKKAYHMFKEKYHFDRNIHIIPTGIEISGFFRKNFKESDINALRDKYGLKKDDFVVLFVGRLGREKSVDLLIEAQSQIIKKYPHCKLVIVGDGPDADSLKKLACRLKCQDNVIFTGKVPLDERFIHYQLPNVFATASRTETQGLTVIEAMAASVPVMCADDDNFKEVVVDGLNGYLFKNKRDYRQKLETLINDQDKLSYLSKQALITAKEHDIKYYGKKIITVYETAIKNNGSPIKWVDKVKRVFERNGDHE